MGVENGRKSLRGRHFYVLERCCFSKSNEAQNPVAQIIQTVYEEAKA